jgi:hypothetical protein
MESTKIETFEVPENWSEERALEQEIEVVNQYRKSPNKKLGALAGAFMMISASGCSTLFFGTMAAGAKMDAMLSEASVSLSERYVANESRDDYIEFKDGRNTVYVLQVSPDSKKLILSGGNGSPTVHKEIDLSTLPKHEGRFAPRIKIFGRELIIGSGHAPDVIRFSANPYVHNGQWDPEAPPMEILK